MKFHIGRLKTTALAAALVLAGGLYAATLPMGQPLQAQQKLKQGESVKDIKELHAEGALKDVVIGKPDAPVTIIEYSSLTCGHCANFHKKVLPEITKKYIDTGKAKYILRDFPLDNLAAAGSLLARCKSGKFSEIMEDLFAHQNDWAFVKDPLPKLKERAKKSGYSDQEFEACLRDQPLLDKIVNIREKASDKFGVNSTPTIFVNGKILRGPSHISQIDELMAAKATDKPAEAAKPADKK